MKNVANMAGLKRKGCILGGTFTCVHAGHLRLLSEARKFQGITLGLTSDAFVRRHKIYPSFPYEKRLAGLRRALAGMGMLGRTRIVKIVDEAGGADRIADAGAIIVSEETRGAAERINISRKRRGLPPLAIISVPLSYGGDLKKISCHSIYEGKTDPKGGLKKPVQIAVGTENPAKLRGARRALARIFGRKFALRAGKVKTGVADHPFNAETFAGAKNRAHAAWRKSKMKCDYSIGMESGLFTLYEGTHIDITACCVYDGKEETYGTGMGFVVPEDMARKIKENKSDLTKVLEEAVGLKDVGRKHGAIGHFSAGVLKRHEQIEQSVLCAFVPRLHRARVPAAPTYDTREELEKLRAEGATLSGKETAKLICKMRKQREKEILCGK